MSKEVLTEISGNLGDQLFIIASAYSYFKRRNSKLKILKSKISYPYYPVYWETLLKKVKPYLIDYHEDYNKYKILDERSYQEYDENKENIDFVYLKGKFQSYKYFSEYKEDIKSLFKSEVFLVNFVSQKYKNLFDQKNRIIVIYYSNYSKINLDKTSYYKKAIDMFIRNKPNPFFMLCVDDDNTRNDLINYIKDINEKEYFIFKDDELLTFTILQQFNDFIISYESFIWWCVWLSDYKHVIVPKEETELYNKDWIRI